MGRLIFLQVCLFLLPFLLFWLWVKVSQRVDIPRPTFWLVLTGLVLAGLGFLVVGSTGGQAPGSDYVPARVEDGRLIRR